MSVPFEPTNQAAWLHGPLDIRVGDAPPPEAGPDDLLLAIHAVGLCGSDRHQYLEGGIGGTPNGRPAILGHELGAVAVGGERAGERVVIDPAVPCGTCPTCRGGRDHVCPDVRFAGLSPTDGGLQRAFAWPSDRCIRVPDGIRDVDMPLLEPAGIALHTLDLASVTPGMRAGVFGCGPIGLLIIRALRAAGVEVAVATDPLPRRLVAAGESGADATVRIVDQQASSPLPTVDVAFECAGEASSTDDALAAVAPGGTALLVGIPAGARASYAAGPARRKEVRLQWVRRMATGDLERAVGLVEAGRLSLAGLVTATYDLGSAADAFGALADRSELKIVITV